MGVKIVLRKRANQDGTRPLILQVWKDKKASTVHLGYNLNEKDWDKKKQEVRSSYPNSVRLNKLLYKKKMEVLGNSLDLEAENREASSEAIIKKIRTKGGSDFFSVAELYLRQLKDGGKYNQYTADKPRIEHFRLFRNGSTIAFSDITPALLEQFKLFLKTSYSAKKKGKKDEFKPLSERSIVNHLVAIRSVFALAIKNGVTDKRFYPFGAGKIAIKFPESNKIGLTIEEVQSIENVELPAGSFQHHARNLWLFSFYAAGARASDVLRIKWSDIQQGRLHYVMGKNAKGGSLKLSPKAIAILDQYKKDRKKLNDFVFPDLKIVEDLHDAFLVQRRIAFTVSRIDKFLKEHVAPVAGIEKTLTMHIARHTFGNISGDKIQLQMLQKLYRHSHITTTINYQSNFIHKDTDEALEAVVGF